MATVRRLVLRSVAVLRTVGAVSAVPISITAVVLDSPRAARSDPGWRPIEVRLERRRTEVRLERGVQRHTVTGETLAFAAHATLAGARTGALVHHTA